MEDCIIFTGHKDRLGYGKLKISGKMVYAHRKAYSDANGCIPEGMLVCHSCDNPSCINPSHLFIGTHADNSRDKCSKGRQSRIVQKHEKNHNAKLSRVDVENIREMIKSGMNNTDISKIFNVTHSAISNIRRGVSWS